MIHDYIQKNWKHDYKGVYITLVTTIKKVIQKEL